MRIKTRLPRSVRDAVNDLKRHLSALYGRRLMGVYLYGSYARGDFTQDSDIDLVLALAGEVNTYKELDRLAPAIAEVCLEHDVLIAAYPVPVVWVTERKSALFENVRKEGVQI